MKSVFVRVTCRITHLAGTESDSNGAIIISDWHWYDCAHGAETENRGPRVIDQGASWCIEVKEATCMTNEIVLIIIFTRR